MIIMASDDVMIMVSNTTQLSNNPWSAEQLNSNVHSLEVVSRYRESKLQVSKKLCDL